MPLNTLFANSESPSPYSPILQLHDSLTKLAPPEETTRLTFNSSTDFRRDLRIHVQVGTTGPTGRVLNLNLATAPRQA